MKPMKELLNFSIINIDKPSGPTSFTVSEYVKKQLGLSKTSHFGTLDPKVTGVLPVALGRACKLTGFFLGHDKEYVGILHTHEDVEMKKLQKLIDKNFVGKITQMPPVKSAVKRAERVREVKRWELLEKDGKDFLFIAEVEGGTYIRKLCSDLGEMINGAHMAELRRVRAGIFSEDDKMVKLDEFSRAVEEYKKGNENKLREMLTPGEEAIKKIFPVVSVKKNAVKALLTGKPLFKRDIVGRVPGEGVFAVFSGDKFVEMAEKTDKKGKEVSSKLEQSSSNIVAKALFVYN